MLLSCCYCALNAFVSYPLQYYVMRTHILDVQLGCGHGLPGILALQRGILFQILQHQHHHSTIRTKQ
jgi:hypothetical protein